MMDCIGEAIPVQACTLVGINKEQQQKDSTCITKTLRKCLQISRPLNPPSQGVVYHVAATPWIKVTLMLYINSSI
jgi:hypothetical protein